MEDHNVYNIDLNLDQNVVRKRCPNFNDCFGEEVACHEGCGLGAMPSKCIPIRCPEYKQVETKYKLEKAEKEIKRLKWYLNEIRNEELSSLDIEHDEYETCCSSTDYSNIVTLVEEALEDVPAEDCRYVDE